METIRTMDANQKELTAPLLEEAEQLNPTTQKSFLKQSQFCSQLQVLLLESRIINTPLGT